MKALVVLLGVGTLVAAGAGIAYAMSSNRDVTLRKGAVYLWADKRGFSAEATKQKYEALQFASVSIAQGADGLVLQGIWTGKDKQVWDVPDGITVPEFQGYPGQG